MTLRLAPALAFAALAASPAFAASDAHGGGGFIGGFMYSLTDPVTHTAFLAFAAFLLIAWRMGALKAITGGLDKRADDIRNELDEAQNLREQAAEALALAERRQQDADKEAEAMTSSVAPASPAPKRKPPRKSAAPRQTLPRPLPSACWPKTRPSTSSNPQPAKSKKPSARRGHIPASPRPISFKTPDLPRSSGVFCIRYPTA